MYRSAPCTGQTTGARRRAPLKVAAVATGAVMALVLVSGCSDDDADSAAPEDVFCEAGDSLRADIQGLGDIDVVAEGTDALNEQFDAISADLDQLEEGGSEVAADDIDALGEALDGLGTALDALGSEVTADSAQAAASAATGVIDAAEAVLATLSSACP